MATPPFLIWQVRELNELFSAFTDGVLLCRLINIAAPETIDERVVHLQR